MAGIPYNAQLYRHPTVHICKYAFIIEHLSLVRITKSESPSLFLPLIALLFGSMTTTTREISEYHVIGAHLKHVIENPSDLPLVIVWTQREGERSLWICIWYGWHEHEENTTERDIMQNFATHRLETAKIKIKFEDMSWHPQICNNNICY